MMFRKLFSLLFLSLMLAGAAQAQTWFFSLPINKKSNQVESEDVKPEALIKLISDLEQRADFKALTYAQIDTAKGKQWVWGYELNAKDQESANSKAMSACIDRMKFVRETSPKSTGFYISEGRSLCDFHDFNKTTK